MTDETELAKLKPCPFCGAKLVQDGPKYPWGHSDDDKDGDCLMRFFDIADFPADIAAWNRRASTAPISDDVVERAIEECQLMCSADADGADYYDGFLAGLETLRHKLAALASQPVTVEIEDPTAKTGKCLDEAIINYKKFACNETRYALDLAIRAHGRDLTALEALKPAVRED